MSDVVQGLLHYRHVVLFLFVLAEQIGLPIPAVPALLSIGALAGTGHGNIALALGVAIAASLPPDIVWYELGRRRGNRVLVLLCRFSLEPDYCVRRTENLFLARGRNALLIAKFFPGLSTVAPPLAGMVGIPRVQFLALDTGAAILWAGTWMGLGYLFSDALERVAVRAARLGHWLGLIAVLAIGGYILLKYVQRQRFLRSLRIARIPPDELLRLLAGPEPVAVIDTRTVLDVEAEPYAVRGAIWIPAEEIQRRSVELPRAAELVLYCS